MNKIASERSAFNRAGSILLHLLTDIEFANDIVKNEKGPVITFNEIDDRSYSNYRDQRDKIIMCLRAGSLSEKHYCGLKCINYDPGMSGDDLWKISRLFYEEKHQSLNFEDHIKSLDEETEKLITEFWPFIVTVTRKLLIKKNLEVSEIHELWEKFQMNL
jgi:hypothetical protein